MKQKRKAFNAKILEKYIQRSSFLVVAGLQAYSQQL